MVAYMLMYALLDKETEVRHTARNRYIVKSSLFRKPGKRFDA